MLGLAGYSLSRLSNFRLQNDRLIQVKMIETARWDLIKGDLDRLIEVEEEVCLEVGISGLKQLTA